MVLITLFVHVGFVCDTLRRFLCDMFSLLCILNSAANTGIDLSARVDVLLFASWTYPESFIYVYNKKSEGLLNYAVSVAHLERYEDFDFSKHEFLALKK